MPDTLLQLDLDQALTATPPASDQVVGGSESADTLKSEALAFDLALDEALMEYAKPLVRIWSTPLRAVVIGAGTKSLTEIDLAKCELDGVKVFRRVSGGSGVLLGADVACFTLVLPYETHPEAQKISTLYECVFGYLERAFSSLGIDTHFEHPGDIATGTKKIVGLAQSRRRKSSIAHGVIPVALKPTEMEKYLLHPPTEPEYRKNRDHATFVTTVEAETGITDTDTVLDALRGAFGGTPHTAPAELIAATQKLVCEKYMLDSWNLRR